MNREELKAKYGDEQIYVIPANKLELKAGFTIQEHNLYEIDIKQNGVFKPRYEMEFNPLYKQIIPYCVVVSGNTNAVFMTKRIKGDSRLVGRTSIGQGGHINPIDNSSDIIKDCIYREINEELGLNKEDIAEIFLKGMIYDPSNEVGLDHLGLVYQVTVIKDDIEIAEKDTLEGSWAFQETLKNNYDNMENWSKIVLDNV